MSSCLVVLPLAVIFICLQLYHILWVEIARPLAGLRGPFVASAFPSGIRSHSGLTVTVFLHSMQGKAVSCCHLLDKHCESPCVAFKDINVLHIFRNKRYLHAASLISCHSCLIELACVISFTGRDFIVSAVSHG